LYFKTVSVFQIFLIRTPRPVKITDITKKSKPTTTPIPPQKKKNPIRPEKMSGKPMINILESNLILFLEFSNILAKQSIPKL